jgi:hypothetical protein
VFGGNDCQEQSSTEDLDIWQDPPVSLFSLSYTFASISSDTNSLPTCNGSHVCGQRTNHRYSHPSSKSSEQHCTDFQSIANAKLLSGTHQHHDVITSIGGERLTATAYLVAYDEVLANGNTPRVSILRHSHCQVYTSAAATTMLGIDIMEDVASVMRKSRLMNLVRKYE